MRVVEVRVIPINDKQTVTSTLITEQKTNESWNRVKAVDIDSATEEGAVVKKFYLEDNQRLVIEGRETTKLVYDREQNAAVPMPMDPAEAEQKRREDEAIAVENKRREDEARKGRDAEREAQAAGAPRTLAGRPIPPSEQVQVGNPPRPAGSPQPTPPLNPTARPGTPPRPGTGTAPTAATAPKAGTPSPSAPATTNTTKPNDHGQGAQSSVDVKKETPA